MMNRLGRNHRLQSAWRSADRPPSAVLASTPTHNVPGLSLAPQQKLFSISVSALRLFYSWALGLLGSSSSSSPFTSPFTSSSSVSTFLFDTNLLPVLERVKQISNFGQLDRFICSISKADSISTRPG